MYQSKRNTKHFTINDHGINISIKQPKIEELTSLYYILLNNLIKINKSWLGELDTS